MIELIQKLSELFVANHLFIGTDYLSLFATAADFQFKIKNKYGIELGTFPCPVNKVHTAGRGGRRPLHTPLLQVQPALQEAFEKVVYPPAGRQFRATSEECSERPLQLGARRSGIPNGTRQQQLR